MYSYESFYSSLVYETGIKNLLDYNTSSHRDMRQEMILYFYTAMLPHITRTKENLHACEDEEDLPTARERRVSTEEERELVVIKDYSGNYDKTIKTSSVPMCTSFKISASDHIGKGGRRKSLKFLRRQLDKPLKQRQKRLHTFSRISILARKKRWTVEHIEENVRIEFINQNKYEGEIFCNMLHGQGKYTWSNGTVYEGEFKNNEITGAGRFQFPDQSVYTGKVYKNYLHGTGLLFPAMSPCIYKGEFHFNVKHGFGWQLFGNDNTYEGQWADDEMSGEGVRRYPSGAVYYGKFAMGKRHGYGVAVMKNNDVYSGDWIQGYRDGFGDYIWNVRTENYFAVPVQSCYYGSWVENNRDGIGVINFGMQGGSRYAGYFSNNEKHGSGVIICENGHVIESSPLFVNDKPVHVSETGDIETSPPVQSSKSSSSSENRTIISCANSIFLDESQKIVRQEKLVKKFPLDQKMPVATPSSDERSFVSLYSYAKPELMKVNKYSADQYRLVFPKFMDQYSSLNIPIGISSELIDLNTYIYKIIEYKSNNQLYYKDRVHNDLDNANYTSSSSSLETYTDYELHKFEEKMIRKGISRYLGQLRTIYSLYAKIGCIDKKTPFKLWLLRIFFWQLYRDCKIPEKGISLIDIDLMLSEKSTCDYYVVHNPFEIIYFWQFLESLLHVALTLYGETFIFSNEGVLNQSFVFLMEEDILPNAGHFQGSALFEYRDVIPIKAAYYWYKSFGEPHTAKEFFKNICELTNSKKKQLNLKQHFDLPYIQIGHNAIHFGNKIFYFEDDENFMPTKPIPPKIKTIQHEKTKKLYFLSNIDPHKIAHILVTICPSIQHNKDILNFEYKLSFLEFFEMILLCTQEKVQMEIKLSDMSLIHHHRMAHHHQHQHHATNEINKKKKRITGSARKLKKAQG